MIKKILLMCCMSFSIIYTEFKPYRVFPSVLVVFTVGHIGYMLGFLGLQRTKKMILEHTLKATGYCALQSVLLYGFSHTLVNFVNNK